ncbi:transporter substrate-binding domain-containing protein [Dasania sp. GY-MA-18]|uniref:Transporter substrate-binding domain-containing protein n=1 Tax=Dasania phycosphaerae TaxID=2950436 RepID=A0A9J6RJX6_9GAMM|nr:MULTISPECIES: transporter substrate-binding domain-containing protein [Dasania]MCR8922067.1 transporter substrate-binding domain-containing protein [Dasania sp. GY-MA-18]MCZ0864495.1 transporter substrate-binding domain-containing protein [Dasania phycosphaerae]MCZ0868223.1 transporter substrate-binding domain-containing protein [Dasania phycosphaerae]
MAQLYKAFLLTLVLSTIANHAQATELTYYVVEKQSRPFQIEANGQSQGGIITDIVSELSQRLNWQLRIKILPFKRMLQDMDKHKHDSWINYAAPAWGVEGVRGAQNRNLVMPAIMEVKHKLLLRADNSFELSSKEDLWGKTLITLMGFDYPGIDAELQQGLIHRLEVKDHYAAIKAVYAQRGLGFVGMENRILYNMKRENIDASLYKLIDFSDVIPSYKIFLGVSPDFDPQLKQQLQQEFVKMKHEGVVETIIARYTTLL